MDQMTIGEFARRSRLSAKALRLYDELGLLPPARVSEDPLDPDHDLSGRPPQCGAPLRCRAR